MLTKKSFFSAAVRVAVFIILPLFVSLFMFARIAGSIRTIAEEKAAKDAEMKSVFISRQIKEEMKYLEIISEYISNGRVPEESMYYALENLIDKSKINNCGILRLDESAVCGETLRTADYKAIRKSFRGESAIMYDKERGFLLTVPVYNNKNIKYVFYQFFDADELLGHAAFSSYDGNAQYAVSDSEQHDTAVFYGDKDVSFFYKSEFFPVALELRKLTGSGHSAAVYCEIDGRREICFASLTDFSNISIIGRIPYSEAAGGIEPLFMLVLVVTLLMLVLLAVGTFYIVSASAKIQESEELRKAKALAEEANRSKGVFIANMSHELRTPISVILGMNEMILREEASASTKERAMDIKSAAQILLSLINDVLDYAKIESGKMNILCAEYSLVEMIRDLSMLTESRAHQKSVQFLLDIEPGLPIALFGDDIRVRQVLTNLLTNAIKYTAEGSVTLKMTGEKTEGGKLMLHCEVKDTGVGIKKEDIDKLLIPFMRVEEDRHRNVEGTGLGMPIIVNLLTLMGSELKIDSVYGEGSTFWFDIEQEIINDEPIGDIHKRIGDMVREYSYRVSFVAPKARILMVDDNSMNRQIFVSLLSKTKIDITTVSSGFKCLELVQKEHFDIIFMDYLMPDMNGIETLIELKKLENNLCKDSPVVALTANAFSGDREKYLESGFDDFLSKPIVTEKLEAMIMRLLPKDYVSEKTEEIPAEDPAELPEIDGVNMGVAKMYLKDNSLILSSLETYYGRLETDLYEIPALYENIDTDKGLGDYRISVHALKGTSGMVGVMMISELSRLLEYAARDGERDKIRAVHPILIEEMEKMLGKLEQFKPKKAETGPAGDISVLKEQLEKLIGLLEEMDIDGTEALMSEIQGFSYEGGLQTLIEKLADDVSFMDYDGGLEKARKALEIIQESAE